MTKNVIVHGDSRNYIPTISTPINLVLTDPPYGMDFTSNSAQTPQGKQFTERIEGDMKPHDAVDLFYSIMGPIVAKLADQAELYIFTAWHVLDWWIPACENLAFIKPDGEVVGYMGYDPEKGKKVPRWAAGHEGYDTGIRYKMMLVWEKGDPGQGDLMGNWGCGHEIALYLKKGRRPIPKRRMAILHHDRVPAGQNIHPTEKPVALLRDLIEMSTDPEDFVVDPFSGSGSTSLAAKQTGRNSLAFEIDERWIARSRERLEMPTLFTV